MDATRHLPGGHNQQAHGNRLGRPGNIAGKTGLGSKAHLARKGTRKPLLDDEVVLTGPEDGAGQVSFPRHFIGRKGRVRSHEEGVLYLEMDDGSTLPDVRAKHVKVTRTREELEPEDRKKLDAEVEAIKKRSGERGLR